MCLNKIQGAAGQEQTLLKAHMWIPRIGRGGRRQEVIQPQYIAISQKGDEEQEKPQNETTLEVGRYFTVTRM